MRFGEVASGGMGTKRDRSFTLMPVSSASSRAALASGASPSTLTAGRELQRQVAEHRPLYTHHDDRFIIHHRQHDHLWRVVFHGVVATAPAQHEPIVTVEFFDRHERGADGFREAAIPRPMRRVTLRRCTFSFYLVRNFSPAPTRPRQ